MNTFTRLNASIPPKVRWLLIILGIHVVMMAFAVVMYPFLEVIRGKGHWILSAQDRDGGMTIRVHNSDSALDKYTVVVEGYGLGRDIAPVVIDSTGPGLPPGITRTFEDGSMLPGRCTLQIGPLTLDVMPGRLEGNGRVCRRGEEIRVRVPPPP